MKLSCNMNPRIKVRGKEVDSNLFKELSKFAGRDNAKMLWGFSQVKELMNRLGEIKYDSNDEPTVDSFLHALPDNMTDNDAVNAKLSGYKEGMITLKGDPIVFDNPSMALNKAIEYNRNHNDMSAVLIQSDNGYIIRVAKSTPDVLAKANKLEFKRDLSNNIVQWLNNIGFSVAPLSVNSPYSGAFNPLSAETTADGLRTIIKIANNEQGEEALTEEFAHVILEGTRGNPLTERFLNLINPETAALILGDHYEEYVARYNNKAEDIKREAAAKLLVDTLQRTAPNITAKNIAQRLWNWVVSKLKGHSAEEINVLESEAAAAANSIVKGIKSGELLYAINEDSLLQSREMYDLDRELPKIEELARKAYDLALKRYHLKKVRTAKNRRADILNEPKKNLLNQEKELDSKHYYLSIALFLKDAYADLQSDNINIKGFLSDTSPSTMEKLRREAELLRNEKEFITAYKGIIKDLKILSIEDIERDGLDADVDMLIKINKDAAHIDTLIDRIEGRYNDIRRDLVYNFLKRFWGEDKIISIGTDKGKAISLKECLDMADKDISFCENIIASLGDASDPILSTIDKVVRMVQSKRDEQIMHDTAILDKYNRELMASGHSDTKFMYVFNKEGVPTGRLVSPYNFDKYYQDRAKYKKSLIDSGMEWPDIYKKMNAWMSQNTREVVVEPRTKLVESVPYKIGADGKNIYASDDLNKLDAAQRKYYDDMMEMKAKANALLPERYVKLYNAVQISNNMLQALSTDAANPRKAAQNALQIIRNSFKINKDDTEFGSTAVDKDEKTVLLGFDSKLVQRLPVYYTDRLEHMELLNTDFTFGMVAFMGMAHDYNEMSKVIDLLELTRDTIEDRGIKATEGGKNMVEKFKEIGKEIVKPYVKLGNESAIKSRLDDYFKRVIYKQDETTSNIPKTEVSAAKATGWAKAFVALSGLGVNLFAGVSNVTMGKVQLYIEAIGNQYFNIKNLAKSEAQYWAAMPDIIKEINSPVKKSKINLLINRFNVLENYFENTRRPGYYQSPLTRIVGNSNVQFMMGMGEHYLHVKTMLAMLDSFKVLDPSKKSTTLYNAFDTVEENGITSLVLKQGYTKEDGSPITDDDIEKFKLTMTKVNSTMNGGFSDVDKGWIQGKCLGRLAMQFRQWMPEHYFRRFAKPYYNAQVDDMREGFYYTFWKYGVDSLKDLRRMKFSFMTNYHALSAEEKANVRRAIAEMTFFWALCLFIRFMGDENDRKGLWWQRMAIYQLKRLKLDIGASTLSPYIFSNAITVLQSPMAAIKSFNNLFSLVEFNNMFTEITIGRYAGWSEYHRDVIENMPILNQYNRVRDLPTENYMYSVLNK